jgi:hypothetical protein
VNGAVCHCRFPISDCRLGPIPYPLHTWGEYREHPLGGFSVGSRKVHGRFTVGSRKVGVAHPFLPLLLIPGGDQGRIGYNSGVALGPWTLLNQVLRGKSPTLLVFEVVSLSSVYQYYLMETSIRPEGVPAHSFAEGILFGCNRLRRLCNYCEVSIDSLGRVIISALLPLTLKNKEM